MKLRFLLRNSLYFGLLAVLPLLYFNCSGKFGAPMAGGFSSSAAQAVPSDGSGNFTGSPGSSGVVLPMQDRNFTFTPQGDSGPFTVSGLPSWATFNSTTGVVSGVVTDMTYTGTFSITGAKSSYGPYSVSVAGNPLKAQQWHLNNTGQSSFAMNAGVAGEDLHLTNTIAAGFTGAGVHVAISDTGGMLSHEALIANVWDGQSRNYLLSAPYIGDPTPDTSTPDYAHGTAVASLALETGWNGYGGRGVAPQAQFASFLFIQAQNALGTAGTLTSALNDQFTGNFDLFNYSWTDPQCTLIEYASTPLFAKLAANSTSQRSGLGSSYFMAAGNNYVDNIQNCNSSLASAPVFDNINFSEINTNIYVVNVAAVNASGVSSSYSTPGSAIWVSGTGGEYGWDTLPANTPTFAGDPAMIAADFVGCSLGIKTLSSTDSAFDRGGTPNTECKYTSTMNGTSSATPVTTGAAALLLQANPHLSWRDVKYILAKTADMVDPNVNPAAHPDTTFNLTGATYDYGWSTNHAGFNFQNYYGFGRINVDKAVAMAQTYTSALGAFTDTNWAQDSGTLTAVIPSNSATGISETLAVPTPGLTIEGVQVRVSVSACAGSIGLLLTAPSGTKSVLMNYNSRIADTEIMDHIFLSNAFYGENSSGTWTLKVIDGFTDCATTPAKLTNWKLNFYGY